MAELLTGLFLAGVGIALGLYVADWDLHLPFLDHRSVFTHGVLLPMGVWWLLISGYTYADPLFEDARISADSWAFGLRFFALGFFSGYAIHMCFDVFPKRWVGGALIKSPFGVFPREGSIAWLLAGLLLSLYLAVRLIHSEAEAMVLLGLLVFLFRYYRKHEDTRWRPFFLMLILSFVIFILEPPTWFRWEIKLPVSF